MKMRERILRLSLFALWLSYSILALWVLLNPHTAGFVFPVFFPLALLLLFSHASFPGNLERASVWSFITISGCCGLLFILWNRLDRPEALILVLNLVLMLMILPFGKAFFWRAARQSAELKERIEELEKKIKSIRQESEFYNSRLSTLKEQIGSRQKLSFFAREMGNLLDPEKIKNILMDKLRGIYPNDKVSLKTAIESDDSIETWVRERRTSLLSRDHRSDQRFKMGPGKEMESSASVIAVPLTIGKNLAGLVRVDSPTPNRFAETDLKQLELFTHLSTLALENAQLFSRINAMATKDSLTGLNTHRSFQERLVEEILRAARYRTPLSLLMMDIDHFKSVNDNYGHLAGDQVLRDAARIVSSNCRNVDFAARYGGEEFALVLPQLDQDDAFRLAEDIRRQVSEHRVSLENTEIAVSVSIGCATFPQDAQIPSQLIRKADERLYRAKQGGRNKVVSV